ncbi:MAG: PHP domain-containing protein, partial [Halobacteriota archaeon]
MKLKADLHVHSGSSYDGEGSVDEILDAAEESGLDVVAVTDHDEIDASLEAVEEAVERDVVAVPGVEVSSADGHVLAWNVRERPRRGRPVEDTVDEIRDLGGVAVIPHPFQRLRHGVGGVEDCDAVEVYNSRLLTGWSNRQARRFASGHGLPMVAGSDAHIVDMIGRAFFHVDADSRTADAVVDAVVAGDTEVGGKRTPLM